MRFELWYLLSLACLAFTAQAAPSAAKNSLLEQKLEQRSAQGKQHQSKDGRHRHRHQQKHNRASAKQKRNVPQAGIRAAEEAASHLVPQEQLLSDLNAEIAGVENARRVQNKNKKHVMQVEDSIHIAKTGKSPPKFPVITRIGSFIGLTSAVLNVFNFLFAAKTTALATTQFSAPPTPPTLIDTPARWDGHGYTMMPLPEDVSEDEKSSKKERRSLDDKAQPQVHAHKHLKRRSLADGPNSSSRASERMVKRRKSQTPAEEDEAPQMEKRWLVASTVGLLAGAALSPGLPSMVTGKWKPEVDKPPFDPYDPNMLKPKDAFSAAVASPDQPLPALPLQAAPASTVANGAPNLDHIRFPESAYTSLTTSNSQGQPLVDPSSLQGAGSSYDGSGPAGSASAQSQAVLRKRAVVSEAKINDDHRGAASSSSSLDKRFMLNGPWSKAAMLITAGSIVPLVYGGVTHARYRTYNPRDRDILKDLDDTPTYGAVGVPGRQPGQLATSAMPGYTDYVAQLENQQAQQQAQASAAAQQQRLAAKEAEMREFQQNSAAQAADADTAGGAQDSEPVLRRRSTDEPKSNVQSFVIPDKAQSRLNKRGFGKLAAGLAVFGGVLGYVQSATQFPQDRDEDKDAKKREMKKQQEAQMAAAQQQGLMQGGQPGGGYPSDASAMSAGGTPLGTDPGTTSPYTFAYPPADSSTAPVLGGGGSVPPSVGTGPGVAFASTYSDLGASGQSGGGYPTYGYGGGSAGDSSSLGASLNAAAGYQASTGSQAGSNVLKKRDVLSDGGKAVSPMHDLEARALSKRTPGFGKALGIAGTTMFFGTLAGNLFMASKQKSKPVPLVTPNANTRGPMIMGGEMYTSYLESKRGQMADSGQGAVASGLDLSTVTPASINYGATSPSYPSQSSAGETSLFNPGSASINPGTMPLENSAPYSYSAQQSSTESGDVAPVLKKRSMVAPADVLIKRAPLAWAVEAETAAASLASKAPELLEAESGAASLLSKAPAVSEAGASAAGSAGRLGGLRGYSGAAGGLTRGSAYASEASLGGLGRSSLMAEGEGASVFRPNPEAWGSARPATVSSLRGTGSPGAPATLEGISGGPGRSSALSGMGYRQLTPQEILEVEQRAAGSAAAADKGLAVGESAEGGKAKGMTMGKALGIIGGGAGATMMFNGIG